MSDQDIREPADNAAADQPEVVRQQPVGVVLRQAREAKGMTVDDIAQVLKLGFRQVEALESGDWAHLPGTTFIRGFVRNYARLVGLDVTPLMAQLDGTLQRPADNLAMNTGAPAEMPRTGVNISRRDRTVIIAGAALVGLAALAYFLVPDDLSVWREKAQSLVDGFSRKEAAAPEASVQAPAAANPTGAAKDGEPVFPPGTSQQQAMYPQALTPADTPAAATPAPVAVPSASAQSVQPAGPVAATRPVDAAAPQLRFMLDKESWIEVRDRNNKVIFSQRLAAGTEQLVSGDGPLSLTVGYAPGVRLFWRGQAIDLAPHAKSDVAR